MAYQKQSEVMPQSHFLVQLFISVQKLCKKSKSKYLIRPQRHIFPKRLHHECVATDSCYASRSRRYLAQAPKTSVSYRCRNRNDFDQIVIYKKNGLSMLHPACLAWVSSIGSSWSFGLIKYMIGLGWLKYQCISSRNNLEILTRKICY